MKMKKKEMAMKEKKYDGFAIASFVLSLVGIIFFDYGGIRDISIFGWDWMLSYSQIIFLLSFIFGIISLFRIKNNKNLKGNFLAIFGIIIPILAFVFYIMMNSSLSLERIK